jgi:hypothetical protein
MAPRARSRAPLLAAAVVVVALAVGAGFLAQPQSAAPLQGRSLAQEVLNQALVPPGSVATESVIASLKGPPSIVGCSPLWDLHRVFLVGSSTDVRSFVQSHLPKGDRITGSGISGGPGVPTVTFFTVTIASTEGSRAPLVLYSYVPSGKRSALRVDAQVMLLTSRCVTHGVTVGTAKVHGTLELAGDTFQTVLTPVAGRVSFSLVHEEMSDVVKFVRVGSSGSSQRRLIRALGRCSQLHRAPN